MKRLKWRGLVLNTHKQHNTDKLQRKLQWISAYVYRLMQKYELTYIDITATPCGNEDYIGYRAKHKDRVIADAYTFEKRRKQND